MNEHHGNGKAVGLIEDDTLQRNFWEVMLLKQDEVLSVAAWESAEAFFADGRHLDLDLLLVDLELPGQGGIEVIRAMQEKQPQTTCIVLTASSDPADVFAAIRAGASGYVVKQASPELLLKNLKAVVQDGMTFSPSIAKLLVAEFLKMDAMPAEGNVPGALDKLTERELKVLELLAEAGSAKGVAAQMGLSHETVRVHMKNIYKKLHVGSKKEAVAILLRTRADG